MNRFFSKLNLHDIKISPEGNRFPPDADEPRDSQEHVDAPIATEDESAPEPGVSDVDTPALNETPSETSTPIPTPNDPPIEDAPRANDVPASEPEHRNGHAVESLENTVGYFADGDLVVAAGDVLKVSARSRPSAVAGAIAGVVREAGRAEVQAIGAGATNQAIKAVAIARDYLSETDIDAVCVPAFIDVTIDNEDRTAIRLVVEPR